VLRRPLLAVALVVAGASCASDGRELADPQPWQTTTTRPVPATAPPPAQAGTTGLALSSPDFAPGGAAPLDATCAGANHHPGLQWAGTPAEAVELAVTLSDQTDPAQPVLVWLAAGIDPGVTSLAAGQLPAGAVETTNDYGLTGWGSPCLESLGGGQRALQFRVHALGTASELTPGFPGNEAWDRVEALAVDSASLLMTVIEAG
jgi:phosphatidylethanolamine-binding protein (PEBP) family uncharacterized protein